MNGDDLSTLFGSDPQTLSSSTHQDDSPGNLYLTATPLETQQSQDDRLKRRIHQYKTLKWIWLILIASDVLIVVLYFVLSNTQIAVEQHHDQLLRQIVLQSPDIKKKKNFKLCTRCASLVSKFGDTTVIRNLMADNEFCCFDEVNQLLMLLKEYTSKYLKQEEEIRFDTCEIPLSRDTVMNISSIQIALHAYHHPSTSKSHTYHKLYWHDRESHKLVNENTTFDVQRYKLHWRDMTSYKSVIEDPFFEVQVLVPGYYHIYSAVSYDMTGVHGSFQHCAHQNEVGTLLCDMFISNGGMTTSSWEGTFWFSQNSSVYVKAPATYIDKEATSSYFGMYLL